MGDGTRKVPALNFLLWISRPQFEQPPKQRIEAIPLAPRYSTAALGAVLASSRKSFTLVCSLGEQHARHLNNSILSVQTKNSHRAITRYRPLLFVRLLWLFVHRSHLSLVTAEHEQTLASQPPPRPRDQRFSVATQPQLAGRENER